MKWLVTGGCGFIGTRLVRELLTESHEIRVIDNLSVGTEEDLWTACGSESVELIVADIRDEATAREAARGIDVVVHLAANTGVAPSVADPRLDCLSNVIGTFNYLDAARHNGVRRFVFASSGAPIGECEPPIHEEMAPHPVSPYGASKLAGEGYCSAFFRTYGLETVALRFGNVYGPGSEHKQSVVAKFIAQALAGETLEIYGDGGQTRDFIFIGDLVEAIRKGGTIGGIGGEIFQIATSRETTLNELSAILMDVLASEGYDGVRVQRALTRPGDVRRNFSDTSKASRILGWRAKTDLREGLRRTVRWFIEHRANMSKSHALPR